MRIVIMLLNAGRGSGEVARLHARRLIARGNEVVFMHRGVGTGVPGAVNIDIPLPGPTAPVHEYLPSGGPDQKAVSTMGYDEAIGFVPFYEQALARVPLRHCRGLALEQLEHGRLLVGQAQFRCDRVKHTGAPIPNLERLGAGIQSEGYLAAVRLGVVDRVVEHLGEGV